MVKGGISYLITKERGKEAEEGRKREMGGEWGVFCVRDTAK